MKNNKGKKRFLGLKITLIVLVVLVAFFATLNNFYIDILWFKEVGYLQVFFKELITKLELGLPVFLVLSLIFSLYFSVLGKMGGKGEKVKFIRKILPLLLGLATSFICSIFISLNLWEKWLLFKNSTPFGTIDPAFGKDISFYMFKLPFYNSIIATFMGIIVLLVIVTFVYSALVITTRDSSEQRVKNVFSADMLSAVADKGIFVEMINNFRIQIGVFGALFMWTLSVFTFFKKYDLVYSGNGVTYGASYTDLNVSMPYLYAIAAICIILGLCLLIFGFTKKFKPIIYCGILAAVVLVGGKAAEIVVQNYIVEPNEYAKESTYIGYTINSTLKAYGLDTVDVVEFPVDNNLDAKAISENEATISNIPINDYSPCLDTYNSMQSIRTYYQFNDVDIDRYMINGNYTQTFVSAREMDTEKLVDSAKTWINTYLRYTHGFGLVVSPVNQVNSSGQPVMIAKDIPPQTTNKELEVTQPRIYFSEKSNTYAVVNTRSGEFDYPSGTDNTVNTYDGTAGIKLGLFNRIAFALRNQTTKFLFSTDITNDSKVLIRRNIRERLNLIAPFLLYDNDAYVVTVGGKVYWIVDAMTISSNYPYSQPYRTEDQSLSFNYCRNSVKAVIDAYNGDVSFYIADENDPIIQSYAKIYPSMFKPMAEMPEGLRAHVRYSEAFFNVQAAMYSTYHMTNTNTFYNQEDVWEVATQIYGTGATAVRVNSAYLIMDLPSRTKEEFMIMVPFAPRNKDNMTAWMTGLCDGEDYGKLLIYQFSKQKMVYGPMQMEQRIDQNTEISAQLTLLSQRGSEVIRGNMLTIPINNNLIYVEAVYVRASSGENNLPEMKKVIVCYGENIVMKDSLADGLSAIFGSAEDKKPQQGTSEEPTGPQGSTASSLAISAGELYTKAIEAQKNGDWAGYGNYITQLGNVIEQLKNITDATDSQVITPTDTTETTPNTIPEEITDPGTTETDNPTQQ